MTLQPHGPAPYTTVAAAITVLDAYRDRGASGPLTVDSVIRSGVAESLASRTLNSLKQLGLLDEGNKPTQQFEDFRLARGDEEYRNRLQEWLRGVYADVLHYADPSTDSPDKIAEAFRTYEPASQKKGMASLLLGLWRYAGLPATSPERSVASAPRKPRPATVTTTATARIASPPAPRRSASPAAATLDGLPQGLVGLLHQIPPNGESWTKQRRDAFVHAFNAVLDFSVPIGAPRPPEPPPSADGDEVSTP